MKQTLVSLATLATLATSESLQLRRMMLYVAIVIAQLSTFTCIVQLL